MSSQRMATVVRGRRILPTVYENFPCVTPGAVGTVQILSGIAILILGIVISVISGVSNMGGACANLSITAIVAGSFGIAAGRGKTACKIVTNLTLSTLSTVSACSLVLVSLVLLVQLQSVSYYNLRLYGCVIALMVFSLIEAIAALWSSIVACHFVCFCCRNCCCQYDDTTTDQILISTSEDQQPLRHVVTVPNDKARNAMQSPPRYEQ